MRTSGRDEPPRPSYGLHGLPLDDGGLQDVSVPVPCGVGEKFCVFPCVVDSVVVPTPAWLLPGPSKVVHVTVPWVLVQLSGSGAAPELPGEATTSAAPSAGRISSFR